MGAVRRSRSGFKPGDSFDFWRVLQADPPRRLRFWSEMKVPGEALLDFTLVPLGQNRSEIQLAASFLPSGLAGILYWYAFLPFHRILFRGMLSAIARSAGRPILRGPDRLILDPKDVCFLPQLNGGGPP